MVRTAAFTVIVGLLVGTFGIASQSRGTVAFGTRQVGYLGDVYAEPPTGGMHYVYFVGERIEVELVLGTGGYASRTVRSPSGFLAGLRCNDREQPSKPKVELHFGTLLKMNRGGSSPVRLDSGDTVALELGERLSLRIEVPAAAMTPGRHILHFETDAIDNDGQPVVPNSPQFKFEVRVATQDDQLELARRSALRAHLGGDYQTARRDVARMLQLNPTSIFAHVIKGDVESAEGAWTAAVASYQTALRLLDSKSDQWLRSEMHLRESIVMLLDRARSRVG